MALLSRWSVSCAIATAQLHQKKGSAVVAAPASAPSVQTRLRRAQVRTMAKVKEAANRLRDARRTGIVRSEGEKTLLLELLGAHGVGLALHGQQQHEEVDAVLKQSAALLRKP